MGRRSFRIFATASGLLADNIRALVQRGEGRGLLSLPTGAGKTRTAVQALVESMADGEIAGAGRFG